VHQERELALLEALTQGMAHPVKARRSRLTFISQSDILDQASEPVLWPDKRLFSRWSKETSPNRREASSFVDEGRREDRTERFLVIGEFDGPM
jgi:hypothetical protein